MLFFPCGTALPLVRLAAAQTEPFDTVDRLTRSQPEKPSLLQISLDAIHLDPFEPHDRLRRDDLVRRSGQIDSLLKRQAPSFALGDESVAPPAAKRRRRLGAFVTERRRRTGQKY